ncbi:hypothetical protein P8625_05485 [Tenacibaculum tangerinum]|uniref:Uncharacterized protein n=1 Tax=Tenacibaculum tangerinum TaxID=3038772 RepID=A0ABY8L5C3_9FLAO|nr:hypothetical protein [Tenacibaculum tangerinum]WGH76612.1 hypothetical protein P8625_05485 [Tenacibaculum tangerinum]
MKSGRLPVNVLIDLYNLGLETKATFDFINKTIKHVQAESIESRQLLNDYSSWLPVHFKNHNCDLTKLESLKITIWTDFKNTLPHEQNKQDRVFEVSAFTIWKADGRKEEIIEISQSQVIPKKFVGIEKMPRMTEMN